MQTNLNYLHSKLSVYRVSSAALDMQPWNTSDRKVGTSYHPSKSLRVCKCKNGKLRVKSV